MHLIRSLTEFNPTKFTGCALWLAADRGVTTVDGNVSTWADQSGNGRHASQPTSGYRPLYVASAQGGRPTLRFDGINPTGDHLIFNTPFAKSMAGTIFFALTLGSKTGYCALMFRSDNSHNPYVRDGKACFFTSSLAAQGTVSIYNTCSILTFQYSSSEYINVRTNGSDLVSKSSGLVTGNWTSVSAGAYSQDYQGDISEIIIFNRALPDAERIRIEQYLSTKYAIALV